jgi:hypothetical protein
MVDWRGPGSRDILLKPPTSHTKEFGRGLWAVRGAAWLSCAPQDNLGNVLLRACQVVPDGILLFLPSYSLLDKLEGMCTLFAVAATTPMNGPMSALRLRAPAHTHAWMDAHSAVCKWMRETSLSSLSSIPINTFPLLSEPRGAPGVGWQHSAVEGDRAMGGGPAVQEAHSHGTQGHGRRV